MEKRPPIVAILGHVDHGKTTLLDYIRKANVAEGEAGGITQAIGAYEIEHGGSKITFIDTPGHAAFSKMRAHGAQAADLAILVVAADDGVMPQTEDAIKHIKEAEIPFIVAINKIDTEGANPDKVKNDLVQSEVYLEGMGGDVSYQEISALNGDGVDDLLDLINLAAEVEEFTYDPEAPAEGIILTSNRDPKRGVMTGMVVKNGTLKKGDEVFSETTSGKLKGMDDFLGNDIQEAKPSSPILMLGFDDLPEVGEKFKVGEKPETTRTPKRKIKRSIPKDDERIKVFAKAGESGSLEVVAEMIDRLSEEELPIVLIGGTVGDIYETDLKNASSFNAIVVGFETKVGKAAQNLAKTQNVDILTSDIIYNLEDDLREYIEEHGIKDKRIIEILKTFGTQEGNQQVIGGRVTEGFVENQEEFEVYHKDEKVGEGRIINLQSSKNDISKAEEEQEVGLLVEADVDIKEGHQLVFTN